MIDVIQIYKSKEIFTKSTYTPENRKRFHDLEISLNSTQGFLEDETLVLPIDYKNLPDVKAANLIIIQDIEGWESFLMNKNLENINLPDWLKKSRREFLISDNKNFFALRQLSNPKAFEIFKLHKSDKDTYELFIDYVSNSMRIGIPERENHKICELKQSKPIRYKINGKSDFTMTGRKGRTFYEFDFIIEWLGTAEKVEFRELNKINKTKIIPKDSCKLIDERKILR